MFVAVIDGSSTNFLKVNLDSDCIAFNVHRFHVNFSFNKNLLQGWIEEMQLMLSPLIAIVCWK